MKQKRRRKKKRKKKYARIRKAGLFLLIFTGIALLLCLTCAAALFWLDSQGRKTLDKKREALPERMEAAAGSGEETEEPEAGTLRYQGKTWAYKNEMLTFLCMGIDKSGGIKAESSPYRGGQADALFLVALDSTEKKISVIAVNRDTMTEISVYDRNGLYAGKETAQIALAHAYGDGLFASCENTVEAVSNLFYGLPVHGYCALNMSVIAELNDAVGGVEVTIPESAQNAELQIGKEMYRTGWTVGQRVLLKGLDAYTFIRYRDIGQPESADARLLRQKQYLQGFIGQAKTAVKQDMTLPLKLYTRLLPYMVTDITANEAVYLAGQALLYSFEEEDIQTLKGEVKMGEQFEEFYHDDDALYELILKVFYREVP